MTSEMTDGRCSSRVLKPPGGGHSQIFGFSGGEEAPISGRFVHKKTEISGCFAQEPYATKAKEEVIIESTTTSNTETQMYHEENSYSHATNGNNIENGKNGDFHAEPEVTSTQEDTKNKENNAAPPTVETPQRKRVPPGGFSTGFW